MTNDEAGRLHYITMNNFKELQLSMDKAGAGVFAIYEHLGLPLSEFLETLAKNDITLKAQYEPTSECIKQVDKTT